MTSTRPLLLVDVDGVINCFGDLGRTLTSFEPEFVVEVERRPYTIRIPLGSGSRLARLAERFEPVWATTWRGHASPTFADRLGLDEWPHLRFSDDGDALTRKLSAVAALVGDRPAAWIDDELYEDAVRWAEARDSRVPTRLVRPVENVGLTEAHTVELLEWASSLAPSD